MPRFLLFKSATKVLGTQVISVITLQQVIELPPYRKSPRNSRAIGFGYFKETSLKSTITLARPEPGYVNIMGILRESQTSYYCRTHDRVVTILSAPFTIFLSQMYSYLWRLILCSAGWPGLGVCFKHGKYTADQTDLENMEAQ